MILKSPNEFTMIWLVQFCMAMSQVIMPTIDQKELYWRNFRLEWHGSDGCCLDVVFEKWMVKNL